MNEEIIMWIKDYVRSEQIYNDNVPEYPIGLGDACGKCMCNVPCSFSNPVKKLTGPKRL